MISSLKDKAKSFFHLILVGEEEEKEEEEEEKKEQFLNSRENLILQTFGKSLLKEENAKSVFTILLYYIVEIKDVSLSIFIEFSISQTLLSSLKIKRILFMKPPCLFILPLNHFQRNILDLIVNFHARHHHYT